LDEDYIKNEFKMSKIEFLTDEFMKNFMINGTGIFSIHNCMNHSCSPNVTSISNLNNHEIGIYFI
jgi:hypothetical protein